MHNLSFEEILRAFSDRCPLAWQARLMGSEKGVVVTLFLLVDATTQVPQVTTVLLSELDLSNKC